MTVIRAKASAHNTAVVPFPGLTCGIVPRTVLRSRARPRKGERGTRTSLPTQPLTPLTDAFRPSPRPHLYAPRT